MSKFEVEPGRARKVWAALLGLLALGALILSHKLSSRVGAAAVLLMAWDLAFVPSLPFNLRLGEIYQRARQGWRMSRTARIINYSSSALIVLSIYRRLHGR